MKYFNGVKTAEEAKQRYHELAKKLHPDNGGDAEEFKTMQVEFSDIWKRVKDIHVSASGNEYRRETHEDASAYMQIVDVILRMDGVDLELCGSWLWATGNTYPYKTEFHRLGFVWSKSKRAWYYTPEGFTGKRRGYYKLDEIRQKFGSEHFEKSSEKSKEIEA